MTNKHGYPEAFVRAVMNDPYSRGDSEYSATSLITPARKLALYEKHKKEIDELIDVDDRVFILYGQIGHAILERSGEAIQNHITEKRYFGEIDGTRISAAVDSLDLESDGTLIDYKFTSVFSFKKDQKPKDEWVKQMNIQLELMRQNGVEVKRMRICGLLRDWRPGEYRKDPATYPNKIAFHEIPIATSNRTRSYISKRIREHKLAKTELPLCTPTERWASQYDAFNRCHQYCEVSKFCTQYKERINERTTAAT